MQEALRRLGDWGRCAVGLASAGLDAIASDIRLPRVIDADGDPTIAVVGAGFTGIELALELRDRVSITAGGVRPHRAH